MLSPAERLALFLLLVSQICLIWCMIALAILHMIVRSSDAPRSQRHD